MNKVQWIMILPFFMVWSAASAVESSGVKLSAEIWEVSRHGEALLKVDELVSFVNAWAEKPSTIIEIRFPGGEEGELWAEELKSWLVSLGVPSDHMRLTPGSDASDVINLSLYEVVRNQ